MKNTSHGITIQTRRNHHEPYRRPMNITTLMCHTSAPSPLAELFFLCRGVYGLRNPADFSMLYARRSSAGAGGFAVNCERDCSARQDCGFFYTQNSGAAVSSGRRAYFLPLTLAVAAIFFIIKAGRRLRLTAIKARVSLFLFVPPARRFFLP